ncbi:hypothetical protein F8S13_14700 [Chloroflexia bacterium SDU3-3]|nr:hypothetical protein F8S13_14700 [Chloroflexia bacterium SDU3-3]
MARLPIEIVDISRSIPEALEQTIQLANSIQEEFLFTYLPNDEEHYFYPYDFAKLNTNDFFETINKIRHSLRGYHPYIIPIVNSFISGSRLTNLFGSHKADQGIAFFTINGVFGDIIPSDRIHCYILYYLARYSLSFVAPKHNNHDETRSCVFDRKISKLDILKSMKNRAFCDDCRKSLIKDDNIITSKQISALDSLFSTTKTLLDHGYTITNTPHQQSNIVITTNNNQHKLQISTNNIIKIIESKQRRLNILNINKSIHGYDTPPHVIMEIEDLEKEIKDLL